MSAQIKARSISRAIGVDRVRPLQRLLYRTAKKEPERRFHALYGDLARGDVLARAWAEVRANRGAPGVDGVAIEALEAAGVGELLDSLAAENACRSLLAAAPAADAYTEARAAGRDRPLAIPTVRYRVVMTAAEMVRSRSSIADLLPESFGFRPRRQAHGALEAVRRTGNRGQVWVLDPDIASCFDEIYRQALVAQIERRVCDRKLALHLLDERWTIEGRRLGTLVRYADDRVPRTLKEGSM